MLFFLWFYFFQKTDIKFFLLFDSCFGGRTTKNSTPCIFASRAIFASLFFRINTIFFKTKFWKKTFLSLSLALIANERENSKCSSCSILIKKTNNNRFEFSNNWKIIACFALLAFWKRGFFSSPICKQTRDLLLFFFEQNIALFNNKIFDKLLFDFLFFCVVVV